MDAFDEHFRLVGDEDGDVGIDCRACDRGGAPIAFLGDPRAYRGTDVYIASGILDLLTAADTHGWKVHGWEPVLVERQRPR